MSASPSVERLDLAVVGAGAAGTATAFAMASARPDWSIEVFERARRIGGRLLSRRMDGAAHPIELGGMRFLTSHPLVSALVDRFGIATHPFDATGGGDRSMLRGVVAAGANDPRAGQAYELAPEEVGQSANALILSALERILPGFRDFDHDDYVEHRARAEYLDRRLTDWSIGEALATALSPEGHEFVVDAFGYDSGMRAFNVADLIEFLFSGGDPTAEARTPDDGMDRIPRELAAGFSAAGGRIRLAHHLHALEVDGDGFVLRFANGRSVHAARVVLAVPVPALKLLAVGSAPLRTAVFGRLFDSAEAFPAMKLYLSYDTPWWRPAVSGIRTVTDLPNRKVFYFDGAEGERSVLLGMYTDGRHVARWTDQQVGGPGGAASPPMLGSVREMLRQVHPAVDVVPKPVDSVLQHWGADPHETGWHFWRPGVISDEMIELARQPDPSLPIHIANEAFSRRQSWVEGALEAADAVVQQLTATSEG